MRAELDRATGMLFRAGVRRITRDDAEVLATNIMEVAGELAGAEGDPAFHIHDAARELEQRIGGLKNLEPYVKTLRAGWRRVRAAR